LLNVEIFHRWWSGATSYLNTENAKRRFEVDGPALVAPVAAEVLAGVPGQVSDPEGSEGSEEEEESEESEEARVANKLTNPRLLKIMEACKEKDYPSWVGVVWEEHTHQSLWRMYNMLQGTDFSKMFGENAIYDITEKFFDLVQSSRKLNVFLSTHWLNTEANWEWTFKDLEGLYFHLQADYVGRLHA
jgi:hypothetical protein